MLKKVVAGFTALVLSLLPVSGLVSAEALPNPIANPQLTQATNGQPTGWAGQSWTSVPNSITPGFEYVTNDGHGDNTSVKVTMANYEKTYTPDPSGQGGALTGDDGDAKWVFTELPVTTGTPTGNQLKVGNQYRFTTWFKGSVTPKIVVDYMDASYNESFFGMPNPLSTSTTNWTQYSETFSIPQGVSYVTVFMFLDQNGWIQSDDYSIDNYTPEGFSEPLLSLTYDDGHEDNVTNLLPLLTQYGYKSTQCFETGTLQTDPTQAQTNVMAFQAAGHEICSHTITHPMLSQISAAQKATELNNSKTYLENLLQTNNASQTTVPDFASPYGDYDQATIDAIKAAGYASHRTVDEGFNSKDNFDAYRLRVQNIFDTTTADQVAAWVAQAKATNTWLILVYHRVVDTTKSGEAGYEAPGQYDTTKDLMNQHLQKIQASGIKVVTMGEGLAETEAQLNGSTPVDTTAPVVTASADATTQPVKITWSADEAFTSSKVEYGTTTAYGSTATSVSSNGSNVATLPTLTANTKYYYRVSATDAANNTGTATGEFTTPADQTPANPVVSGLSTGTPTTTTATVTWTSDPLTTTKFEYGTTTAYGTVKTDAVLATSHTTNLTGLTANTTYYFRITATNLTGQTTVVTGQFKTAAQQGKTGDLTGEGVVDDDDATILFANWGNNPKAGDINKDGVVDDDDATLLFANWSK